MKVQAQICMVINLDKCIGCHTCSVTCKNVWTSRKGMEYAWFNNVETKPGIGYPKKWEDQEKWQGGWEVKDGKAVLRHGSRPTILGKLFSSPRQPEVKDYYEPFTFDFDTLKQSLRRKTAPTARPYSIATGKRMDKVEDGPNWEDNLAGPFAARSADPNLKARTPWATKSSKPPSCSICRVSASTACIRPARRPARAARFISAAKTAWC